MKSETFWECLSQIRDYIPDFCKDFTHGSALETAFVRVVTYHCNW